MLYNMHHTRYESILIRHVRSSLPSLHLETYTSTGLCFACFHVEQTGDHFRSMHRGTVEGMRKLLAC